MGAVDGERAVEPAAGGLLEGQARRYPTLVSFAGETDLAELHLVHLGPVDDQIGATGWAAQRSGDVDTSVELPLHALEPVGEIGERREAEAWNLHRSAYGKLGEIGAPDDPPEIDR